MDTCVPNARPDTPPRRGRIVIVDDHEFFAACLRTLLDNESDLMVCDVTASSADLDDRVRRLDPDLLVIDLSLGAESGVALARRLRQEHRIGTPILFVSTLGCPSEAELASIDRCAFIAKTRRPAQFLAAVRELLDDPRRRAPFRSASPGLACELIPAM